MRDKKPNLGKASLDRRIGQMGSSRQRLITRRFEPL